MRGTPIYGCVIAPPLPTAEGSDSWYEDKPVEGPFENKHIPRDCGEIIGAWLEEHKYDGLCGDECGCELDDLFPCCESPLDCVPAYNNPERAKEEGCTFWMQPTKEEDNG